MVLLNKFIIIIIIIAIIVIVIVESFFQMRFFWGQSFSMINFQPYKQFLVKPLKDRFSFRGVSVCYLATLAKNSLSRTTSRALKGVWGGQNKKNRKKNKNKTFIWIGSEIQICRTSVGLAWEFFFCSYNNNSNDILILILKMVRVTVR